MSYKRLLILLFVSFQLSALFGQAIIKGKVTDAETGEGMPFVNVYFKGTTIGVTTDFDGYYSISDPGGHDSLAVSYIGYYTNTKYIGGRTTINFQVTSSSTSLEEIVIVAGENPAWEIMRRVIANKKKNDPRSIKSYNYESYTKAEFDVDNLTEKFKKKIVLRPFKKLLDSLKLMAGEEGKMILPVFISESLSRFYVENDPRKTKEIIEASNVTGVGMTDGSLISQLAGTSFQQYNFYENWLSIIEKNFVSPLSSGWKSTYRYYLLDSLYVGDHFCYKIEVEPKRTQDLAFSGIIWIDTEDYALKQLSVSVGKQANLNYIEQIKIQQEYTETKEGAWLVENSRILIEVEKLTENWVGMICKFYVSNRDFKVNEQKEPEFFEQPVEVVDGALEKGDEYWNDKRHDTLSVTEQSVYHMVDSIRNIPMVKTYIELVDIAVNGYAKVGMFDIGPYLYVYSFNNIEGHRIRLGARTNMDFSKKAVFRAHLAYGFKDKRWKYLAKARYIFNRQPWTEMEVQANADIVQLGLIEETSSDDNLFMAFSNFGTLNQPFFFKEKHVSFKTDILKGFTQSVQLTNKEYVGLYPFAYYKSPTEVKETFTISEIEFKGRYAFKERYLLSGNKRYSFWNSKYPILTLAYSHGFKGVLGSDLTYDKWSLNLAQKVKFGKLGNVKYSFTAGKILSPIPYPMLKVHLGNETFFHNQLSFNLMNYFEFVSDEYFSLIYQHHFMGQVLNRIPLMKRLKWRLLGDVNVLYGTLRQENQDIIPAFTPDGLPIATFSSLDRFKPYIEVGYGIENIFRIIRIEAMHRLTYYNQPNANRFGIRMALQFEL